MKTIAAYTLVFLSAICVTEAVLRIIMPREVCYGIQMSPGSKFVDDRFGIMLKPNYKGYAFHWHRAFMTPFSVGEHGLRNTVYPENRRPASARVVLMGGRSLIFNMHLPDEQTIASSIARHAYCGLDVFNASWPGYPVEKTFTLYRERLEEELAPDLVVLFLYLELSLAPAFSDTYEPPAYENAEPDTMTRLRRQSFLLERLAQKAGSLVSACKGVAPAAGKWAESFHIKEELEQFLPARLMVVRDHRNTEDRHRALKRLRKSVYPRYSGPAQENQARKFAGMLLGYQKYFNQHGARLLVAFLPTRNVKAMSLHDRVMAILPRGLNYINLQQEGLHLKQGPLPGTYKIGIHEDDIGIRHFNAEMSDRMGKAIAYRSCMILGKDD